VLSSISNPAFGVLVDHTFLRFIQIPWYFKLGFALPLFPSPHIQLLGRPTNRRSQRQCNLRKRVIIAVVILLVTCLTEMPIKSAIIFLRWSTGTKDDTPGNPFVDSFKPYRPLHRHLVRRGPGKKKQTKIWCVTSREIGECCRPHVQ
jgi:hypothetical protein